MKKISLVIVLALIACVGSSTPRNPMKAQPAAVKSTTASPVDSKTPPVEKCDEHKHKKKIKFVAPNKGCMYETLEDLEKALEQERKQREKAERSKRYF